MSKPFQGEGASTVPLAVTTTTGNVAFLSAARTGCQVRIHNAGAVTVFIRFGTSAITVTTSNGMPVPAGGVEVFTVAIDATHVAGITAAGSATLYATPGYGE